MKLHRLGLILIYYSVSLNQRHQTIFLLCLWFPVVFGGDVVKRNSYSRWVRDSALFWREVTRLICIFFRLLITYDGCRLSLSGSGQQPNAKCSGTAYLTSHRVVPISVLFKE